MHICLINLPRYEIHRPPLSLAILSSLCSLEQVDHSCLDFSLEIWKRLPDDFQDIDTFCITKIISQDVRQRLQDLVDRTVRDILVRHPDCLFAMSLLSTWSQPVCEMFCDSIRRQSRCEIVLGGQGLISQEWTQQMQSDGRIDHYIIGEGEISFRRFLQGQRTGPGINNYDFQQIDDLDEHCVIPDYRRLPLSEYPHLNERQDLFITASRGCVRNCGYCDIGHQWKKYRYRSAQHVAEEMITQFERHGIRDFFFTDSLINGSMKMLNELCDYLIEYKQRRPDADFKWRGQYIFRPVSTVKEIHVQKMAEAGVDYLIVGLETGSDRVRYDMNKKHTNQDAEWYLEMFQKYGITCHLLMITGWVTETLEDHQETLKMFSKWQKYVANGVITGIELGSTLTMLEHAPVSQRAEELGIYYLNDKPYLWQASANPDLTVVERMRRRVETHREAMKYHWPITRSLYRLSTVKRNLIEAIDYLRSNPMPQPPRRSFRILSSVDSGQPQSF